jgi:aldehyde:ferredoxin oxidoreductase
MSVMLPRYYELRSWDENGIPTEKALLPREVVAAG